MLIKAIIDAIAYVPPAPTDEKIKKDYKIGRNWQAEKTTN